MAADYFGAMYSGPLSNITTSIQGSHVGTINHYGTTESDKDKHKACIASLRQEDPEDVRTGLNLWAGKPTEGTCKWIFDNTIFQKWQSDETTQLLQPLIWIGDERNMGKTTMALFLSDYLETTYPNKKDSMVLYYFCNRQAQNRNTATSILKGFIFQLYKKQEDLGLILYTEWQLCHDALFEPHSLTALWRVFRSMMNKSLTKRIFCIIDGVDECHAQGHETELEHFMKLLREYFARHNERQAALQRPSSSTEPAALPTLPPPSGNGAAKVPEWRVIVLTRESPTCVVQELSPFPRLVQDEGERSPGGSDLQRHIDASANNVSMKYAGSKEPSKQIQETISVAMNGCEAPDFVWVTLVAEKLMGMTQTQMKKYVKRMPKSIDGLHMQILLEAPSRRRASLVAVLKWVAFAVRPLSLLELTKAVKYTIAASFSMRALKKVLTLCSGLVRTCERADKSTQVILASSSVLDLLTHQRSPLRQNKKLKDFAFEEGLAHSELANACIAYLQGTANLRKSRRVRIKPSDTLGSADSAYMRKHPFLEYAMVHWPAHAKNGTLDKTDYACQFFQDDAGRRRLWWESYWISLRQRFAWKWTAPGAFSLLHMAAFFDIIPLAQYVEKQGRIPTLVGAEDHQGMKPINWATERSQAAMVKFLLQRGDSNDEALRTAARAGEASIVAMLLESRTRMMRSPPPTSPGSWPVTPTSPLQFMRKATLSTISDWSKKLEPTDDASSTPLSPDAKGYGTFASESPLHIAATCGHDEVVQILIANGEDVERVTEGGWTPLHNAAWFGRVSAIESLTAAKANVNASTKEGLRPLHCAIRNDQVDAVESLLRKPEIEIEAEDMFGLTPFHMACKMDNVPIMEILLDYGASIERKMRQGWTPLIWACVHGKVNVVEFLLLKGANVHAKWSQMVAEAKGAIELGPIGVAKAYWDSRPEGSERLTRLLVRFGAIDSDRMTVDANVLLPAITVEETYNVPVVPDIGGLDNAVLESETDHLDSGSSDESDNDGEEGSEGSDDEAPSRKQFLDNVGSPGSTQTHSQEPVLGLGISEGSDGPPPASDSDVAVQDDATRSGSETAISNGHALHSRIVRKPVATAVAVKPQGVPEIPELPELPEESEVLATAAAATSPAIEERRSSSVPSLAASLSDRFRRMAPNKINRSPSQDTTGDGTAVQHDFDSSETVAGADRDIDRVCEEPSLLGRFATRQAFSWKSDTSGSPQAPSSPKPEIVNGASTMAGAREETLDTVPSNSAGRVFGRFSSGRALSWKSEGKTERNRKGSTPTAIEESEEMTDGSTTTVANSAFAIAPSSLDVTDESKTMTPASSPLPDVPPKSGRFGARKMFGKRTPTTSQASSTLAGNPAVEMKACTVEQAEDVPRRLNAADSMPKDEPGDSHLAVESHT
ncbi:hypothetical protein LTR17_008050 [Elasticomyces elasticus]|nr:hypothetical protein LTR17_008050 [Elasticomyces elasticus]